LTVFGTVTKKIFLGGIPETHLQLSEFLLQDPALPPQAPAQLKSQTTVLTAAPINVKEKVRAI
jgi:hypothetical protein